MEDKKIKTNCIEVTVSTCDFWTCDNQAETKLKCIKKAFNNERFVVSTGIEPISTV